MTWATNDETGPGPHADWLALAVLADRAQVVALQLFERVDAWAGQVGYVARWFAQAAGHIAQFNRLPAHAAGRQQYGSLRHGLCRGEGQVVEQRGLQDVEGDAGVGHDPLGGRLVPKVAD